MIARSRLALVSALAIVPAFSSARAQVPLHLGHASTSTVSVRIMAMVGDIRVVGWDKDSVDVMGTLPKGTRADLNAGGPSNASAGMKMFVEPPNDQAARDGKLVVRVPRGARVWLKAGSADMDVTGVTGGLDLNVVGGSITVHGNPRECRAESMDGKVAIDGTQEWLRVKTATGDIWLRGGQDIGASSISGMIRSSGGSVERAKLETTTGAIFFSTDVARGASVELESHSGSIEVEIPKKVELELDVATITGKIMNTWSHTKPSSGKEGRGMTLSVDGGIASGRVAIRSFKGLVQIRER